MTHNPFYDDNEEYGYEAQEGENDYREGYTPKTLREFLAVPHQPQQPLLAPFILEGGLAMLYAERGVGKTHLALAIALAIAGNVPLLGWKPHGARKVLYVDGEMPLPLMQQRLSFHMTALKLKEPPAGFSILSADACHGLPDLGKHTGQHELSRPLRGCSLLVLDNLSSLLKGGENESTDWQTMQDWLLALRRKKVSVLLVHHAGKNGQQRGTSRREDVLDTVLKLVHPLNYRPSEGARFEVHVEKARQAWGPQVEPFEARLVSEGSEWGWQRHAIAPISAEDRQQAIATLTAKGLGVNEIADKVGVNRTTVYRHQRELEKPNAALL